MLIMCYWESCNIRVKQTNQNNMCSKGMESPKTISFSIIIFVGSFTAWIQFDVSLYYCISNKTSRPSHVDFFYCCRVLNLEYIESNKSVSNTSCETVENRFVFRIRMIPLDLVLWGINFHIFPTIDCQVPVLRVSAVRLCLLVRGLNQLWLVMD